MHFVHCDVEKVIAKSDNDWHNGVYFSRI